MTQEDILKGNKLIAEFMGEEIGHENMVLRDRFWTPMKYNTSWDWLVPVIKEIFIMPFSENRGLEEYIDEHLHPFAIGFHTTISNAHGKVIRFIKWYNKQKTV